MQLEPSRLFRESRRSQCDHSRRTRIPAICAQGKQKKQHAEQVLALGDPCHGFDIDGMQRKQRSHHRTAARITRRLQQYPEQQHHIQYMQ